jgi:NADH:ubiquinone oxidoreductase subunit H
MSNFYELVSGLIFLLVAVGHVFVSALLTIWNFMTAVAVAQLIETRLACHLQMRRGPRPY